MSGRKNHLEDRKNELKNRINAAKNYKEKILKIVHENLIRLRNREINSFEYHGRLNESLNNKSAEEWTNYYDSYIKDCENLLSDCEKKIRSDKRKTTLKVSALFGFSIVALLILGFFSQQFITGLTVKTIKQVYTDKLNLVVEENRDYGIKLKNLGKLDWFRVSGEIEGEGTIKIYLENF